MKWLKTLRNRRLQRVLDALEKDHRVDQAHYFKLDRDDTIGIHRLSGYITGVEHAINTIEREMGR